MEKIYARVVNGSIEEYPVYAIHIKNRSHPIEWYTEVVYADKPELPEFSYAEEVLTVNNGIVNCDYVIKPLTLSALISSVSSDINPTATDSPTSIKVLDLDPKLVDKIIELAQQYAVDKLENFVKTEGYDSVVSAISYKDSTTPKYASEATQVIAMRDNLWTTLIKYSEDVKSGAVPFPKTLKDIDTIIPVFSFTTAMTNNP